MNSEFYAINPIIVTMSQDVVATPVFKKSGSGAAPNASGISMRMIMEAAGPTIVIGGELGAWTLEGSANLRD